MATTVNGRLTRSKRCGFNRLSKESHDRSTSALAADAGKYYQSFDVEQDWSLTKTQHLILFGGKRATLLKTSQPFGLPTDISRETSIQHRIGRDTDTVFNGVMCPACKTYVVRDKHCSLCGLEL